MRTLQGTKQLVPPTPDVARRSTVFSQVAVGDSRPASHVTLVAAVRAEFQKARRSAALRAAVVAPIALVLVALALSVLSSSGPGAAAYNFCLNVWNWWYALFLPGTVGIVASSLMHLDTRLGMRGVLGVPGSPALTFVAKTVLGVAMLLFSTLIVALTSIVVPLVLGGAGVPVSDALPATLLIMLTGAWLVPVTLALTARFGMLAGFAVTFLGDVALGVFGWQMGLIGALMPSAVRLLAMVPVLGIMPNGLSYDASSPYATFVSDNLGTYAAGIVVSVAACVFVTTLASRAFSKREAR